VSFFSVLPPTGALAETLPCTPNRPKRLWSSPFSIVLKVLAAPPPDRANGGGSVPGSRFVPAAQKSAPKAFPPPVFPGLNLSSQKPEVNLLALTKRPTQVAHPQACFFGA